MEKGSFLIYLDYEEQFNLLNDEQAGKLIKAIIKYEKENTIPDIKDGIIKMAFSFIKAQLDRDREKWNDEKTKRSHAGKKGMAKRWQKDNKEVTNDNKNNNVINVITNDNKNNNVKSVIKRNNKNN